MQVALTLATTALYLAGAALSGRRLLGAGPGAGPAMLLPALVLPAVALHGLLLYDTTVTGAGIRLGLFDAASLVIWAAAVVLALASFARPVTGLGLAVLPLAAAAVIASTALPAGHPASTLPSPGVQLHVASSMLAYGLLLLAMLQALLLAYQTRRLGGHRPGGILTRLPPLTSQESLLFQLVGAGFFALSLSLASGVAFVDDMLAQHLVHKTVLSALAWGMFGILLWGRWRRGWRGRLATRLVLAGFVLLLLAYFGTKLVLEFVLDRHWYGR